MDILLYHENANIQYWLCQPAQMSNFLKSQSPSSSWTGPTLDPVTTVRKLEIGFPGRTRRLVDKQLARLYSPLLETSVGIGKAF